MQPERNNLDFKPERAEHRDKVFAAARDFMAAKDSKRLANRQRQPSRQKVLF